MLDDAIMDRIRRWLRAAFRETCNKETNTQYNHHFAIMASAEVLSAWEAVQIGLPAQPHDCY